MSTITWIREVKCKDCEFFKYYMKGKRKYHKCTELNINVTLKDRPWCGLDSYKYRESYYPKMLKMKKTAESVLRKARERNIPVLVLTAKDKCALAAVKRYTEECVSWGCDEDHISEIIKIEENFEDYKLNNPESMQLPT